MTSRAWYQWPWLAALVVGVVALLALIGGLPVAEW